jgi:hypothetical protein
VATDEGADPLLIAEEQSTIRQAFGHRSPKTLDELARRRSFDWHESPGSS